MRALKFKFIRLEQGKERERKREKRRGRDGTKRKEKRDGTRQTASPATRATIRFSRSRSPPFAIPPLFHYSGVDAGIKPGLDGRRAIKL